MTEKYILRGHDVVPCSDLMEWARWFQSAERHVANDEIGQVRVSTVFLGVNHRFGPGSPLVFETMIFGGPHDQYQERYSTWDEAIAGHAKALEVVRGGLH